MFDKVIMGYFSGLFEAIPSFLGTRIGTVTADQWVELVVGNDVRWDKADWISDLFRIVEGGTYKMHIGDLASSAILHIVCEYDNMLVSSFKMQWIIDRIAQPKCNQSGTLYLSLICCHSSHFYSLIYIYQERTKGAEILFYTEYSMDN